MDHDEYRATEELFPSDEESDDSVGSERSVKSSPDAKTLNIDHAMNNPSFSEHLDSILGFSDCNEKISCIFDIKSQNLQQENENPTTKLNEIKLNDNSNKSLISIENNSGKLEFSPEKVNVSDYSSSQENKQSLAQNSRSSSSSHYCPSNLESYAVTSSMSPEASTSQHSNFSCHFDDVLSPDWKPFRSPDLRNHSMISSPISSTNIKLDKRYFKKSLSSQAHPNSNTFHRPNPHIFELNSSSSSFDGLLNSPPTSDKTSYDSALRDLFHCWKRLHITDTLDRNVQYTQGSRISDLFSSLSRNFGNTTNEHHSHSSDILDLNEEGPSTHDILSTEKPPFIVYASLNSKIRCESASSLSDLPSESKISPQATSSTISQFPTEAPNYASKLNFDSDTSSDDSKEKIPTLTGSSVRKFSETSEPRKKRKTSDLSEPSENQSTLPKIDNHKKVSENPHLSPSSENLDEKSSKAKDWEPVCNTLGSSERMNSEISERNQSSRKRLISDSEVSDSDEADVKNKKNKKL